MNGKINAYALPELSCPSCQKVIDAAAPITSSVPRGFKKGSIVICAYCSSVLRMGDASFSRMSDAEIKNLDPISREVIKKAVRSVRTKIDAQ